MIFLLDNADSFVHSLYQYLGELGAEPRVVRSSRITAEAIMTEDGHGILRNFLACGRRA